MNAIKELDKQKTLKKIKAPKFPPPPGIITDRKNEKQYVRGRLLGEGGFAVCYEVFDEDHKRLAAKVICKASLKNEKQKQKLLAEIRIHQAMRHRNIVEFIHVFEDESYVYLILEICENRTMVDLLRKKKRLNEEETRFFMKQILAGVEYLHNHHIIHRDLKLGNFFLTKDLQVKIGDFGLAAYIKHDGERKKTICGTPNYIAPEVLFDSENGHSYEVDVWSLGVVMYTLLVGKPPFQTPEVKAIYKRIRDCAYEFPVALELSEESMDLVSSLLTSKPENRPGLFDIRYHSFFADHSESAAPKAEANNNLPAPAPETARVATINTIQTGISTHPAPLRARNTPNKFLDTPRDLAAGQFQKDTATTPNVPLSVVGSPADSLPSPKSPVPVKSKHVPAQKQPPELHTDHLPVFEAVLTRLKDAIDLYKASAASNDFKKLTLTAADGKAAAEKLAAEQPFVFVSRWIDYSNKWGLGYQLSNGSIGVYFNDQTNLVMASDQVHFEYLDWLTLGGKLTLNRTAFTANNYPTTLSKKVGLVKYFKQFMSDNLYRATASASSSSDPAVTDMEYVNKYLRTKHAVLFRLSNRVVQLNFYDHTKFILCADAAVITILGPGRNVERTIDLHSLLLEGNSTLVDKLKYIKNLMSTLISLKRKKKQEHLASLKEAIAHSENEEPHIHNIQAHPASVPTNQFVKLSLC